MRAGGSPAAGKLRRGRMASAALLCGLVLAGCGASPSGRSTAPVPRATQHAQSSTATVSSEARKRRELAKRRALPALTHGTLVRALGRKLHAALSPMGSNSGVMVTDLSSNKSLYALRASVKRPPASVEKIYTTVALLDLMGAGARLHTTVLGVGHLGKHGIWYGNLYLRGGGDPTFGDGYWNKVDEDGYGPTATQLVAQLRKRGIASVSGSVFGDESLFDADRGGPATGDKPDTPDYDGQLSALVYDHGVTAGRLSPAQFAAHELTLTMALEGIKAHAAKRAQRTPAGAQTLAQVSSPPMSVMVRLMDVPSDDLFADLFAKQLGARFFGQGTLAGGAIEVRQVLGSRYGLSPIVYDGSGLDHADRTSPAQVVSLLRQVASQRVGRELQQALPVVGKQGTVAEIGLKTDAAGHCVAKTGTLDNVTNLAGYCHTRSGDKVAFAMFVDGPSNWQAVTGLSKAIGAIAAY